MFVNIIQYFLRNANVDNAYGRSNLYGDGTHKFFS